MHLNNKHNDILKKFLKTKNKFSQLDFRAKYVAFFIYNINDKKYLKNSKLDKFEARLFKIIFYELHAYFYTKVVKGYRFYTVSRLIQNFLFLRTKENLRLVLFASNPYNVSAFIHGIRSQIELNALLNKFTFENDSYFEEYFKKSEDRKNDNKLINILTLIEKLDDEFVNYKELYENLSNLLHPNPSAVKIYAQAVPNINSSLFSPTINIYFDDTFPNTLESKNWFKTYIHFFALTLIHFFQLFENLNKEFFINEKEKKDYENIAMLEILNSKEFLKYFDSNKPKTIDIEDFLKWLDNKKK